MDQVDTIYLNKLTVYKQLKQLGGEGYDIFVNLCEAYLEWEVPGIDVIYYLELLDLPFTGPSSSLYDPSKEMMKLVAFYESVLTPKYILQKKRVTQSENICGLNFPLFLKPAKAGDSLGIDADAKVESPEKLTLQLEKLFKEYDEILIEEYIEGREFTVLVAANKLERTVTAFLPVEYQFPKGREFKTYALKTSELHTDANIPVKDFVLAERLKDASIRIFKAFNGVGYARLDFRLNQLNELYFLEINFTCSVFYQDGYEGSADYILQFDGIGQEGFLNHIIQEGIARHERKRKKYSLKPNAISGYGIYAKCSIKKGMVIFKGEEIPQRLVSKKYVDQHWTEAEKLNFKKYAYPMGKDIYLLWSHLPQDWAPQNHSCESNTAFQGLDVIATRDIEQGEELTLDYTLFLDGEAASFECTCGSINCRGTIKPITRGH